MFLRLLNSKAPWNTLKYSLHQCSRILSLWSRWNYFCKLNPYFWFVSDNLPLFTMTFSCDIRFKFFLPPWRIYRCVTANMKTIKTQSEPNPSIFHIWSLGGGRRLEWPHLLSHDLHWENKAYKLRRFIEDACLGLTLLIEVMLGWRSLRRQAISLAYFMYTCMIVRSGVFLFVKTTEHLTNDHEKVLFLHKPTGYF